MRKLFLAIAVLGLALISFAPAASAMGSNNDHKVWVCKYVDKPGVDEVLKAGKQPIQVDVSAADDFIGASFKDGQIRSVVIDFVTKANTDKHNDYTGEAQCPSTVPTTTTSSPSSSTSTTSVSTTTEAPTSSTSTTGVPETTTSITESTTTSLPPSTTSSPPSTTTSTPSSSTTSPPPTTTSTVASTTSSIPTTTVAPSTSAPSTSSTTTTARQTPPTSSTPPTSGSVPPPSPGKLPFTGGHGWLAGFGALLLALGAAGCAVDKRKLAR